MAAAVKSSSRKIDWDDGKVKVEIKKDKDKERIKKDFNRCVDKNQGPAIVCLTQTSQCGVTVSEIVIPPILKGIVAAKFPDQAEKLNPVIDRGSKRVFSSMKQSSKPVAKCVVKTSGKIMKKSYGTSVDRSSCCDGKSVDRSSCCDASKKA